MRYVSSMATSRLLVAGFPRWLLWVWLWIAPLAAQQTTWTGALSASWGTAGNWSNGVPNATTSAVILNAVPFNPSTNGVAGAACLNLTVAAGRVLDIAAGFPLEVNGNATLGSQPTGTGTLRCLGTGTIGGTLGNTTVGGATRTFQATTINGQLTQEPGATILLALAVVTVNGNATFQGVTVNGAASGGTLNVRGNLTWATTGVVTFSVPMSVRCGGNWADTTGNFQPATSLVTFDGSALQVVTGTPRWFDLTISSPGGVSIQSTGTAEVVRNLNVNGTRTLSSSSLAVFRVGGTNTVVGTLSLTNARLEVAGACLLNPGGTTTLGASQTHVFDGNLTVNNHTLNTGANSTVHLRGTGTATSFSGGALGNVLVTGAYALGNNTINGNLTVAAATLTSNPGTVLVQGDATLTGNTSFNGASGGGGTLDVRGDLDWSTTQPVTFSNSVTVRCRGDWHTNGNFQPVTGTVWFEGTTLQVVTGASPQWFHLRIAGSGGTQVQSLGTASIAGDLTIGVNTSLVAASLAEVHVVGSCTTASPLTIAGALRVDAACSFGSTANLGSGQTHRFGGNLAINTTNSLFAGTGSTVSLEGAGTLTVTLGNTFPNLTISGNYTLAPTTTVAGDFLLTQTGTITQPSIGPLNAVVLLVTGNAEFRGTVAGAAGVNRTINVRGDLLLQTASVFTQAVGPETIRCGRNWTSDGSYQPSAGVVVFDGTGTQTATAASLNLRQATVGTSSSLVLAVANLTVQQNLVVDGSFDTPTVSMDVQGDLIVNATGIVNVGGGDQRVSGDLTVDGVTTGPGELVMDGTGVLSGAGTAGLVRIEGDVTADSVDVGALVLTSGTLSVAANKTLQVLGAADFRGGTLNGGAGSVLDIDGDTRMVGVVAGASPPLIRAAGNWTANSGFQPGTVVFQPIGISIINSEPPRSQVRFTDIQLQGGTTLTGSAGSMTVTNLTVFAGATFKISAAPLAVSTVNMVVNGELQVLAGADVQLGNGSLVTVGTTGQWSLLGDPGNRCVLRGASASRWRAVVQGLLHAREFELRDLDDFRSAADRGGLRLLPGAQLGPPPYDGSDGLLAAAGTDPNGALLWLANGQSLDFYNLTFLDSGGVPFKNVATAAQAPIAYRMFQYEGNLGGAGFEDDPNAVIGWLSQGRTMLNSWAARSGLQRIDVTFATLQEIDTTFFQIWRRDSPGGIPTLVATRTATGTPTTGAAYSFTDTPLLDSTRYYYEIDDVRPNRPPRRLTEVTARAWQAQAGTAFFVGVGGIASISAALAAAPDGSTILVGPGTYPAFTLNRPMRIVADGTGPVLIDTSLASMVVRDVPVGAGDVSLYGLQIGSVTSPFGLQVVNCDDIVVLDEVTARSQATGLTIDDCPRVALQLVECRGTQALDIRNQSSVFLSRGDVTTLSATVGSRVTYAGLTLGSSSHDATSIVHAVAATSPRLSFPMAWSGLQSYTISIESDVGDFYLLQAGFTRAFVDLSLFLPADMVALVDPGASFSVGSGSVVGPGPVVLSVVGPESPAAWGAVLSLQVVALRALAPRPFLLGNVRDAIFVP